MFPGRVRKPLRKTGTRTTKDIQKERTTQLNEKNVGEGDYVLYWMQEAQRAEYNHALEYAAQRANELEQRLLVVFGLTKVFPITYDHQTTPLPGPRLWGP